MRKVARLSKHQLRQRALKGWVTRRSRGWKPRVSASVQEFGHDHNAMALVWDAAKYATQHHQAGDTSYAFAVDAATHLAPRLVKREVGIQLDDWARAKTNHYQWHRPNGEKVDITGYERREFNSTVRPVLTHLDAKLKDDITLHTSIHRKHASPAMRLATTLIAGTPLALAGLTYPTLEEQMKAYEETYKETKGRKPTQKERDRTEAMLKMRGLKKDRTHILMTPGLSDFPVTRDLVQPQTLVHEVGHAVDRNRRYSNSREWRTSARWKRSAGHATGFDKALEGEKLPGHKSGSYQGMSPSEDFAETFSRAVLHSMPRSKKDDIVYDRKRREFMETKIVDRQRKPVKAQVKRKWY